MPTFNLSANGTKFELRFVARAVLLLAEALWPPIVSNEF